MDKLKYIGCLLAVFLSGFIVSANLTRLIEQNSNYEASWWKVAFAVFLCVMFASFGYHHARKD